MTTVRQRQEIFERIFSSKENAPLMRFIDAVPLGIVAVFKREVVFANRYLETLTGYRLEELLGRKTFPFFRNEEEWRKFGELLYSLLDKGEREVCLLWEFLRKDGSTFPAEVITVPVEKINGSWLVLSTIRDATMEVAKQDRLRERIDLYHGRLLKSYHKLKKQKEFLFRLVENFPLGMAVWKEGEILYQNSIFEGYVSDDENLLSFLEERVFGEEGEFRFRRGEKIFYALLKSLDEGHRLLVLHDLTAFLKMQERLEDFVEARTEIRLAEERLKFLGTMTAEIVHELNTPVTFMKTNLHVLKAYLEGLERFLGEFEISREDERRFKKMFHEMREILASFDLGLERVVQIVRSVKSLGRREESGEEVDLGEALNEALSLTYNRTKRLLKIIVDGRPFRFGQFTPPYRVRVKACKGPLVQMFVIVVNNAAEAAKERRTKRASLEICGKRSEDGFHLSFRDNCGGVPEEKLLKITKPFYSTKKEGSGLGLYILTELARSQGVGLSLRNRREPSGFEVCFFFPFRKKGFDEEGLKWPLKC